MNRAQKNRIVFGFAGTLILMATGCAALRTAGQGAPLPSWNDGPAKAAVVDFVQRVTTAESADFVPQPERIAVFDNDGTLWSEQPIYFQVAFAVDRVKAMAPRHPEWKDKQPFKSIMAGDLKTALATSEHALAELLAVTHTGNTNEEFTAAVYKWITTARHPKTGRLYPEMTFQPMLELLAYLRANGFATYIVSGGGIEFMRVFSEQVYGIPPQQVIGSSVRVKYEVRDQTPVLIRQPEIHFVDDKAGKPVGIHYHIGRRPIVAVGNSDGDFEMLEWTTSGPGPRFGVLVHHDDARREWAYDRNSSVGKLDRGLNEAGRRGWVVVSMKDDWKTIYGE